MFCLCRSRPLVNGQLVAERALCIQNAPGQQGENAVYLLLYLH